MLLRTVLGHSLFFIDTDLNLIGGYTIMCITSLFTLWSIVFRKMGHGASAYKAVFCVQACLTFCFFYDFKLELLSKISSYPQEIHCIAHGCDVTIFIFLHLFINVVESIWCIVHMNVCIRLQNGKSASLIISANP